MNWVRIITPPKVRQKQARQALDHALDSVVEIVISGVISPDRANLIQRLAQVASDLGAALTTIEMEMLTDLLRELTRPK